MPRIAHAATASAPTGPLTVQDVLATVPAIFGSGRRVRTGHVLVKWFRFDDQRE